MAVKILFQTQCCVDGCYAKKKKGHGMCAKHQADYDSGKRLMINYGAVVQKQPRAALAEGYEAYANPHTCPQCDWQCSCSDQPCSCCDGTAALADGGDD